LLANYYKWRIFKEYNTLDVVTHFLPKEIAWFMMLYFVYTLFSHTANGRTVGKAICGIRVVTPGETRSEMWFHRLVFFMSRWLIACVSLMLLGIGHILGGIRKDKRALHDLVVGTRVIKQSCTE